MLVKTVILLLITIFVLYCEGKVNRLDSRIYKLRTANQYKQVLRFTVQSCASFSITNVQALTSCPFSTDNSNINVDYFCETGSNTVYIIAKTAPAPFTVQVVGVVTSTCSNGEFSGNTCGIFHEVAKGNGITCASDFCTPTTSYAISCSGGSGYDPYRDNFVYFNSAALTELGCKEVGSDPRSCCASVGAACSNTCPTADYSLQAATVAAPVSISANVPIAFKYTFSKAVTISGFKIKVDSVTGSTMGSVLFQVGPFMLTIPVNNLVVGENSIPLNAQFDVPSGASIIATGLCTNCGGAATLSLSTYATSPTDSTTTLSYVFSKYNNVATSNLLVAYPIFDDPACTSKRISSKKANPILF